MIEQRLIIRAIRGDFSYDPDTIRLFSYIDLGRRGKLRPESKLKFVELTKEDRSKVIEPFLEIEKHEAQKLMDDLWDCGLRPSEGSGSAGALRKTENHLADMRKIAFHKLGIREKEESQV